MDFDPSVESIDSLVDTTSDICAGIAWLWDGEEVVKNNFSIYVKKTINGKTTIRDFGLYDWKEGTHGMLSYLSSVRSHIFAKTPELIESCNIELKLLGNPGSMCFESLKSLSEKLIEHNLHGYDLNKEQVDSGIALKIPKYMKKIVDEAHANQ